MDAIYDGYAAGYDALGQGRWGAALARFALSAMLPRWGSGARTALDLACGTGAAGLVLADAGVAVVGLDRSAAMLCVARRKAAERGVALSLVRGDLRAFAFGRRFDLVVCCFDSLNYLTEPHEFIAALRCARDALAEGGIFICDLTTRYAYTGELNGVTHEFDLGDLAYRWRTTWDERGGLAMTDIRLLVREGGRESRCAERHTQRPYAPGEVRAALRQAGLRPLATHGVGAGGEPALEPPAADAPRAIYVAGRAP